jgi:hypothetical protein
VKLPSFPIFNKGDVKKEEPASSSGLPREESPKKLKIEYLIISISLLVLLVSLGLILVFTDFFSERPFSDFFSERPFSRDLTSNQTQITPTPSPTPKPLPTGRQVYNYSHSDSVAGPKPTRVVVDPIDPKQGDTQSISVEIGYITPVLNASIVLITDNQRVEYPLALAEGNANQGTWVANWEVEDSYNHTYQIDITIDGVAESFSGGLAFR